MSLVSASIRTPVAPVARHSEASSLSCASSVEGALSRAAPRGHLFRRNFQHSLKKASVHSTCHNSDGVSRALLTPGGWFPRLTWAIMGGCLMVVLITVLARNSMCPISMLIPRLQVSARQAEHSIRSVPVQVAHELINAGHRCLDVRTQEEFVAGHVEGAVNIPYLLKVGSGMTKNHRFLEEVEGEFGKDDEIIVSCQSGRRSMMAAAELRSANFTGITDMGGGYLAWKESGLPTVHEKRTPSHSV